MFYVGQKVVCIDDNWAGYPIWVAHVPNRPIRREIYTVRSIYSYGGSSGLLLEELKNPITEWRHVTCEGGFLVRRFRPAVERKTSIEIFTRMLNPSKERETV